MKGKRKKGRPKKRWEENIKEWTWGILLAQTRAAEDKSKWKGNVVVIHDQRPCKVKSKTRLDQTGLPEFHFH